jgi:hypothetical protein
VLFLDEPTTGLDPTSRVRMWGVIRELVADGVTLLLTTQYLDEADELADRIVVIDHGRVIAEGTAAELKAQTGGARLEVTLSEPPPARRRARAVRRRARAHVSHDGRRLRAPVRNRGGLATTVVRALDEAGITVDDVEVHQPSLDDVFFALTGHPTRWSSPHRRRNPTWRLRTDERHHARPHPTTAAPRGLVRRSRDVVVLTGATSSTSPASRCSSPTSPSSRSCSRCCSSTSSAPASSCRRRQLQGLRDRRPARAQPHHLGDGHRGRAQRRPQQRRHRPLPDAPDVATRRARRAIARRPAHGRLCTLIVALTGLRHRLAPDAGIGGTASPASALPALQLRPVVGLRLPGILSKGPESAQGIGLVILFPLAIVSNALVPTQHMPRCCGSIADWNPVSAVTAAARSCSGTPTLGDDPRLADAAPGRRIWSLSLLAIFVPLATVLYRRRTVD